MSAVRRIADEPAFVLHQYDWSESSLILEVFTRHHGRVALVAKGVKRPTSSYRCVLLPLQPLRLAFAAEGEIRTLKGAEWQGGHVMPTGSALLSGYYVNELLLLLLARDDAHPRLFDHYARVVLMLAQGDVLLEAALRTFELLLLRELGWLPRLDVQTLAHMDLQDGQPYVLDAEGGLRGAQAHELRHALPGAQWHALQAALDQAAPFTATLELCAGGATGALKPQLRRVLQYHCGGQGLRTRQLMRELQAL
ncbi:MAG: DNA repair protein RecO [Rhodoferax sp.]